MLSPLQQLLLTFLNMRFLINMLLADSLACANVRRTPPVLRGISPGQRLTQPVRPKAEQHPQRLTQRLRSSRWPRPTAVPLWTPRWSRLTAGPLRWPRWPRLIAAHLRHPRWPRKRTNQLQCGIVRNAVIAHRETKGEVLPEEYETLLVPRNACLVFNPPY